MFSGLRNILLLLSMLVAVLSQAATVLYSDDFSDPTVWPEYSGSASIKEVETPSGKLLTYYVAFYPTQYKTYDGVMKTGYLDFRNGGSSVTQTTSYVQYPDMKFVNGGTVSVVYGAGSTNKKLQLQEWNGTAWVDGDYETVTTVKSSKWYTQNWTIAGTGTKRLRLVILSSGHLYIASTEVTTNSAVISSSEDTINVNSLRKGAVVDPVITLAPEHLDLTAISVATESDYLTLSYDGDSYSKSVVMPSEGGSLYVRVDASALEVGNYIDSLKLYAVGASVTKTVFVKTNVVDKSSEAYVLAIDIDGYIGNINTPDESIVIEVGDDAVFPLTDSDISVSVSDYASYDITEFTIPSPTELEATSPVLTVTAEDGTSKVYSLSFRSNAGIATDVDEAEEGFVSATSSAIVFHSFNGAVAEVFSLSGGKVVTENIKSDNHVLPLSSGVYVVLVSGRTFKLVVR
ncbi:MAG: hypothetical protein J6P49_03590 [Paludibacteraceae bacterium]|nr:hypothetical protein [Paludibacteraceae bacterium]